MFSSRLDAVHRRLWRIAQAPVLCDLQDEARRLAEDVSVQLDILRNAGTNGWNAAKAELLTQLDQAHCVATIAQSRPSSTVARGLVLFELAARDGGLAALCLSRFLGQMPIAEFGTEQQKARYASGDHLLHGALCLTEPIPGAGAEALLLTGTYRPVGDAAALFLEIDKRGRFTSQMEFADFVVAAVRGIEAACGSTLVVLEPGDMGTFDRGAPVRKIGHRIASTTHPAFRLRVPAERIVGGYTMEAGVLRPRFDHRQLLAPALRRSRTLLALMTAAKALRVATSLSLDGTSAHASLGLACADLWATGEAAASLGFYAARLNDALDSGNGDDLLDAAEVNLFASAAKLFASTRIPPAFARVGAEAGAAAFDLLPYAADAQVETVYMGPEATQRRAISAIFGKTSFDAKFAGWIDELDAFAASRSAPAVRNLAAGFRLWLKTLRDLRNETGADGGFHSVRQTDAFALADALSGLLAARSLLLDSEDLDTNEPHREATITADLVRLATAGAVSRATQICAGQICGGSSHTLPAGAQQEWFGLRAAACASLAGFSYARERLAQLLSNCGRKEGASFRL